MQETPWMWVPVLVLVAGLALSLAQNAPQSIDAPTTENVQGSSP